MEILQSVQKQLTFANAFSRKRLRSLDDETHDITTHRRNEQRHQDNVTASSNVFNTYELREQVLSHLATEDLVIATQVNEAWRDTILQSSKLRIRLLAGEPVPRAASLSIFADVACGKKYFHRFRLSNGHLLLLRSARANVELWVPSPRGLPGCILDSGRTKVTLDADQKGVTAVWYDGPENGNRLVWCKKLRLTDEKSNITDEEALQRWELMVRVREKNDPVALRALWQWHVATRFRDR